MLRISIETPILLYTYTMTKALKIAVEALKLKKEQTVPLP